MEGRNPKKKPDKFQKQRGDADEDAIRNPRMRDARGRWIRRSDTSSGGQHGRKPTNQPQYVLTRETLILQSVDGKAVEWTIRKAADRKIAESALDGTYIQVRPDETWRRVDETMAHHRARLQDLVAEWFHKRRNERDIPFEVDLEIRQLCGSLWVFRESLRQRALIQRGERQQHTED
jgi:hypothetical protein